jgi:hypothetical protein
MKLKVNDKFKVTVGLRASRVFICKYSSRNTAVTAMTFWKWREI